VIGRGFDSLAALAEKSSMKAYYQNLSTYNRSVPLFGSLAWYLVCVVHNYEPLFVGVQYDPMHIRAESGPCGIIRWERSRNG
jgi:hypothetical protein